MTVDLGGQRGALLLEATDGGVEGLAHLHELELAVLDGALVTTQLLDVGLHGLQLLRRADLTGVHPGLDLGGLARERPGFVVELLLFLRDAVAFGSARGQLRVELRGPLLGGVQRLAFGKRLVTVEQSLEGGVSLLQREEHVELARHCPPFPFPRLPGAVTAGVVGAGAAGGGGRRRQLLHRGELRRGVGRERADGRRCWSGPPCVTFCDPRAHTGPGSGSGMSGSPRAPRS